VNSVLIAEPIRTLYGVVHVPPPVILVHVSERGIDTTLGGDGVRSSRKEFGNASSVESSLCQTEGSAQTCTSGSDNDGVVLMVLCSSPVSESP
jgi:hypothetical protein